MTNPLFLDGTCRYGLLHQWERFHSSRRMVRFAPELQGVAHATPPHVRPEDRALERGTGRPAFAPPATHRPRTAVAGDTGEAVRVIGTHHP
ncbi:hypothetical protein GCM10010393_06390 [Streptomyces gobitricini]|uniref:Uncharacterized protein n=1 Tax=Streptomyces gobitricini TaxID=68211 RepID=A0ABN3LA16_9ACTN